MARGVTSSGVRGAFTLIELLVVVSIISLLVAILLPALAKARETAQALLCANNLRQSAVAIHGYANDSRGAIPFAAWWDAGGPDGTFSYAWDDLIDPYLGGRWSLEERRRVAAPGPRMHEVLQCPRDPRAEQPYDGLGLGPLATRSYAMVRAMVDGQVKGVAATSDDGLPPQQFRLDTDLPSPTSTFLMVEHPAQQFVDQANNLQGGHWFAEIDSPEHQVPLTNYYNFGVPGASASTGRSMATHGNGADGLRHYQYGDGHVESLRVVDTLGTAGSVEDAPAGPWTRRTGD